MERRNFDIPDSLWGEIAPRLTGKRVRPGSIDDRRFIEAVMWILWHGAAWSELPPEYGNWETVYRRFSRWRDDGTWERLLEVFSRHPDFGWLMIDVSRAESMVRDGRPSVRICQNQKYPWPWVRMVCKSDFAALTLPHLLMGKISGM